MKYPEQAHYTEPTPTLSQAVEWFSLDDSQVAALLKACDRSIREGVRNYAMLLLFLDCGLRLMELIGLRMTDVSLAQRSLKIHGKGAKDRIAFMGARDETKALRRWLEIRGFKPGYSDSVFIDRKGEALKPRWVQEIISRIGKRAKLKGKLSPQASACVGYAGREKRHGCLHVAEALWLGVCRDGDAICECGISGFAGSSREGQSVDRLLGG